VEPRRGWGLVEAASGRKRRSLALRWINERRGPFGLIQINSNGCKSTHSKYQSERRRQSLIAPLEEPKPAITAATRAAI